MVSAFAVSANKLELGAEIVLFTAARPCASVRFCIPLTAVAFRQPCPILLRG